MIVSQPSDATETSLQLLFGNRILHRDSAVFNAVRAQVISQVTFQVGSHVKSQVESHVKPRVKSQVNSHVKSQVKCQVSSRVSGQASNQVSSQVSSQIMSQRGTVAGRPKASGYFKSIPSRPGIAPKTSGTPNLSSRHCPNHSQTIPTT